MELLVGVGRRGGGGEERGGGEEGSRKVKEGISITRHVHIEQS